MVTLENHADWVYVNKNLEVVDQGNGIEGLRVVLPDDEAGFAFFRIQAENMGEANIVLQWKGPRSTRIEQVAAQGRLPEAQRMCPANKGFIEVLSRDSKVLTVENIYDRWRPGSGTKVIQG